MDTQKYRSKLSKKNPYYISEHRYLELKHYCLQLPEWEKELRETGSFLKGIEYKDQVQAPLSDPTSSIAIRRLELMSNIYLIKNVCRLADPELSDYIFESVTRGRSYEYLQTKLNIPCSRNTFYDRYRRFFWLLSKENNRVHYIPYSRKLF